MSLEKKSKNEAQSPLAIRVLRMRELTRYINRGKSTIHQDIAAGRFPAPDIRLGPNAVGWDIDTVDAWLESRRVTTWH